MHLFDPDSSKRLERSPFSTRWNGVSTVLEIAEHGAVPICMADRTAGIERDFQAILAYLGRTTEPVYGVNTLPGHRISKVLDRAEIERFARSLLASHTLGEAPWFEAPAARCILAAKLMAFSAGGSMCSGELYAHLLSAARDTAFAPEIPQHASYSSGDVICGAHLARALLNYPSPDAYRPKPGEVMSLVNGSYVHLGHAVSIVRTLDRVFRHFMSASALTLTLGDGHAIIEHARATSSGGIGQWFEAIGVALGKSATQNHHQPSVSVRATPEVAAAFYNSAVAFLDTLDCLLGQPSNNPLWVTNGEGHVQPVSQASFVAPSLALASDNLVSAVLMGAWLCCARLNFMLSGMREIPGDGARDPADISFIQMPKYAWQKLERLRRRHGTRAFASGAATSQGIEDFWTMGLEIINDLNEALSAMDTIAALEWGTAIVLANRFDAANQRSPDLAGLLDPLGPEQALQLIEKAGAFREGSLLEPKLEAY